MDKQQRETYLEKDESFTVPGSELFRHCLSSQNAGEDNVQAEIVGDCDVAGATTSAQKDGTQFDLAVPSTLYPVSLGSAIKDIIVTPPDAINEVSEMVHDYVHDSDCVDVIAEGKNYTAEGKEAQDEADYGHLVEDVYCLSENNSEFDSDSEEPEEESKTAASADPDDEGGVADENSALQEYKPLLQPRFSS